MSQWEKDEYLNIFTVFITFKRVLWVDSLKLVVVAMQIVKYNGDEQNFVYDIT